ncbi:alpha/beta fold hydrolase [Acholeplasma granularum]|uniref:alpha/beta fold hydrolase n=1 Tax=Acholeplasma granularum TaxID=264635 RepID=UPI0004701B9F|nr:alpha/beta fold hydrolase [Acholeplasma granularum]
MLINQVLIYSENHFVKNPKGIVIVTHGIALHSLYYRRIAELLNQADYSVVLYDVRGHGKSQGKRGDIKNVFQFTSDLYELVEQTKKHNNLPIYLLGHSMGGIITKLYATLYDNFDGSIIVSSPHQTPKLGIFGMLPAFIFGGLRIKTDFSDTRLSHFPPTDNVDPYALKSFTYRLIIQTLKRGIKNIQKQISNYKKPVLAIHGSDDQIVNIKESIDFIESLKTNSKKFIEISGGYHNLNDDTVTEEALNQIILWLNEQVS